MSRILSVKQGIEYFRTQRDKSTDQSRWTYYDSEIDRLRKKLYELEVEKQFDEYDKTV